MRKRISCSLVHKQALEVTPGPWMATEAVDLAIPTQGLQLVSPHLNSKLAQTIFI